METSQEPVDEKKKRKRNKQVLKSIRQQVEFYFSDANLRKDRFLKQEIERSADRYVEVAVIANFNRMKVLCSDPALISQALSTSDLLELNDDKTQIRRKTPLGEPEYDPDDVTVYVECLPKLVDHDWLRRVFGVCGSVAYVSLPRYKSTGDPKGFAFIEFKTPEEANRACEMLNNPPEEDTGKLGRFPKTKGRRYVPVDEDDDGNKDEKRSNLDYDEEGRSSGKKRSHDDDDDDDTHKRHKRRHRDSESSDVGKPDRHKRKRQHSDDGGDANSHGRKKRQESGKGNRKQDSNVEDVKDSKSKDEKRLESSDHHSRGEKDDDHDKIKKRRRDDGDDLKGRDDDGSQSKKNRQSETVKSKDVQTAEEPKESDTKEKNESGDTKEEKQLSDESQKSSQSEKAKKKDKPIMEESKEKCDDTKEEQDHSSSKGRTKQTEVENDDENNETDEKASRDDEGSSKSRKRKYSDAATELDDNASKKTKSSNSMKDSRSNEHAGDKRSATREDDEEEKGKKKRTRKKKQEKKKEKEKETKDNDVKLRVISKKDWVELKHKYLSLQKASLAKIKEAFRNNIYGDDKKVIDESMESKAVKSSEPEFTPGVVLKIEMKKAMESRQKLKDGLQTVAPVAYIDLQPGDLSGYVRCKTTEGATEILNKYGPNETSSDISITLVSGEDEHQYWEKLKADRSNKLGSKQKKKKKRGVDRLLCKAEKASLADMEKGSHIHFDDDD